MKNSEIAIIGAGHMGGALIAGLVSSGHSAKHIWAVDHHAAKLAKIKATYAINTTTDIHEAVSTADVLVLATKPLSIKTVILDLLPALKKRKPLLISVAAGIRITTISQLLDQALHEYPIIRAMPNIPALIGCGATALSANSFVTPEQKSLAESILRSVGAVVWIEDEALMDGVTALSGSGPAYFFLILQALEDGAVELGLPRDIAHMLTLETALGATKMAVESNVSFKEMAHLVASPGGTTEKALSQLEENNQLYQLLFKALKAAKLRSEELAKEE